MCKRQFPYRLSMLVLVLITSACGADQAVPQSAGIATQVALPADSSAATAAPAATATPPTATAEPAVTAVPPTAIPTPPTAIIVATAESESIMKERNMQLITVTERGDAKGVTALLDQGADVHARNANGVTALIAAAYQNHLDVVDLLIAAGADVNVQDNTQQSAYLISTSEGYVELLQRTLQAGADVRSTDSYNGTGLIRAADRGHVEIIEELLKTDININHVNRLGWTALLEAIILGDGGSRHTQVVQLLADAGADVNLADSKGVTPLAHAQAGGYDAMIAILQEAGARK